MSEENCIIYATITTRGVEAGLDEFLRFFSLTGQAPVKGAVLVEVPSSKIRRPSAPPFSASLPLSISDCYGDPKPERPGVSAFSFHNRHDTFVWVNTATTISQNVPAIDLDAFIKMSRTINGFGAQCADLRSTTQGLRSALQISGFPVSAPDARFKELCQRADNSAAYGSYITIATAGSPITVRTSIASLTTVYFHHRGSPRYWIVIPPKYKETFEQRVLAEFAPPGATEICSQYIRHLNIWIEPSRLEEWGIDFFQFKQNASQLVFFLPGSYFYGYSEGFSIIESKVHAGEDWKSDGYRFCDDIKYDLCSTFGIPLKLSIPGPDKSKSQMQDPPALFGKRSLEATIPERAAKRVNTKATENNRPDARDNPSPQKIILDNQNASPPQANALISSDSGLSRLNAISIQPDYESYLNRKTIDDDDFDISDDEGFDHNAVGSKADRISQLEQQNVSLMRDLAFARAERDGLKNRKDMYKARLLDREELIKRFESEAVTKDQRIAALDLQVSNLQLGAYNVKAQMEGNKKAAIAATFGEVLAFVNGRLGDER